MFYRLTKRSLIVCAGLVAVLSMVSVAILIWLVLRAFDQAISKAVQDRLAPVIVLLDFSESLAVGNKVAAYSMTTEEFQGRNSLERFSMFVDQHPGLSSQWTENKEVQQTHESVVFEVRGKLTGEEYYKFRVRVKKEKQVWKVADIVEIIDE